jgi:hypothetical protein
VGDESQVAAQNYGLLETGCVKLRNGDAIGVEAEMKWVV